MRTSRVTWRMFAAWWQEHRAHRRGVVDDATPIVVDQAIKKRERDEVFEQLTARRTIARDSA